MKLLEKIESLQRLGDLAEVRWETGKAKRAPNGRVHLELPIQTHPFKSSAETIQKEFEKAVLQGQTAQVKWEGFMMASHPVLHLEGQVDNEELQDLYEKLKEKGMKTSGRWWKLMPPGEYGARHGDKVSRN